MQTMKNCLHGHKDTSDVLLDMVSSNLAGQPVGIYSICSANRYVLEAGMAQAKVDETIVCIESTSNQVNQFGGYTSMRPADFCRFVAGVASDLDFSPHRILLGGDHLGPHVWQAEPALQAMAKARDLVRSYVLAGYTKIHLDASMRCADDPGDRQTPLSEVVITERTVELCEAAELAFSELPSGTPAPVYVIGTEVPVPGGEQEMETGLSVTKTTDVERTISLARDTFLSRGLESAWDRVIAVVVQPGVEFGDATVFDYHPQNARDLSSYLESNWKMVYEAHSTDYQKREALEQLVKDHFAILKVGPWLTFAFREAVFAMDLMEREWLSGRKGETLSNVRATLEKAMLDRPEHWIKYYHGTDAYLHFAREFSFSDRSRYYWPQPEVQAALAHLLSNLSRNPVPLSLLSQYLPCQYQAVRNGRISLAPAELIRHKIMEVIDIYASACGMR